MQKPETESITEEMSARPRHTPSSLPVPTSTATSSTRTAPARESWRETVAPWWRAATAIFPAFLMSRFIFLLLTYFGGVLFFVNNYDPTARSLHDVLYSWYRWDAIRYTTIAIQGYLTTQNTAFFPLFPALIRLVSILLHLDVLVAGGVVSFLCFFFFFSG